MTIPLRLCLIGEWSFVRCFRDSCLFFLCFSWSWGLKCCLVWCPLRPAPLFALVFVVLSFFSFVMGMFVGDAFLSVFLSLRRWGNPSPVWGLGFPCDSSSWTRSTTTTRTSCSAPLASQAPAPAFLLIFFLSSSSFAGLVVVGLGLSVFCLAGWFFVGCFRLLWWCPSRCIACKMLSR